MTTKKLHNGTKVSLTTPTRLVDGKRHLLTKAEIAERSTQAATALAQSVTAFIKIYRDKKAETFLYKDVPMRLNDGARADLTAMFFTVVLNTAIPDAQVMLNWQERGYNNLPITAKMLRDDGMMIAGHRQKCFTAADIVTTAHKEKPYTSIKAVKTAFDTAYG